MTPKRIHLIAPGEIKTDCMRLAANAHSVGWCDRNRVTCKNCKKTVALIETGQEKYRQGIYRAPYSSDEKWKQHHTKMQELFKKGE